MAPDKHLRQMQAAVRRRSAELNAEASQKRIEREADKLVREHLRKQEHQEAVALAKVRIREMGGAGVGTGSAGQKAKNSRAVNKANQRRVAGKKK